MPHSSLITTRPLLQRISQGLAAPSAYAAAPASPRVPLQLPSTASNSFGAASPLPTRVDSQRRERQAHARNYSSWATTASTRIPRRTAPGVDGAKFGSLSQCSSWPSNRRAFHATAPRRREHHFDTLQIVRRLKSEGFSDDQSVALMRVLNDVIEESIQNLKKTMVIREG